MLNDVRRVVPVAKNKKSHVISQQILAQRLELATDVCMLARGWVFMKWASRAVHVRRRQMHLTTALQAHSWYRERKLQLISRERQMIQRQLSKEVVARWRDEARTMHFRKELAKDHAAFEARIGDLHEKYRALLADLRRRQRKALLVRHAFAHWKENSMGLRSKCREKCTFPLIY